MFMLPLVVHILADSSGDGSTTVTTHSTAPATPVWVLLLLGLIAIIPGIWGGYTSIVTRRDMKQRDEKRATEGEGRIGVQFAQTAFAQLQTEVDALHNERREWQLEREQWTKERESWHGDRLKLLTRIEALNFQILKLRQALETAGVQVPDMKLPDLTAGL